MDLLKKLQIPPGRNVDVVNAPKGFSLGVNKKTSKGGPDDDAVLVFATDSKALKTHAKKAIDAAKEDRISWIAYPKSAKLGTDLHRDRLVELMKPFGIQSVRMVSIDDVWSAVRFRPNRRG